MLRFSEPMGCVEVIAGSMFSGKTEELIRRLRRAIIGRQLVVAFKPVIDDRYHAEDLMTHDGLTLTARPVKDVAEIARLGSDADVVGLDEAQFFEDDIVDVVQGLAKAGKRVIIAGLDMDFRGVPFGAMPQLLAVAERLDKLQAVCTVCGGSATRSQRVVASHEKVVVGGTAVYEARCRKHWNPRPVFSTDRRMEERES